MTTIAIPAHGDITVPTQVIDNIGTVHGGDRVETWLAGLGPLLAEVLEELDARLVPGEPDLSYHLVLFAERADGMHIAIKCTTPNDEQRSEAAAVHALSDAGIGPKLIMEDLGRGLLVMERVMPGNTMPTGMPTLRDDAEITSMIASMSRRIAAETDLSTWRDDLVPVRDYSAALGTVDRSTALWEHHRRDIELALDLREALLGAADRRDVVLHGDLHHYNVLRSASDLPKVIDPKGLVGPPGYDAGAFMYNPAAIQHHPDFAALTRQRIDIWSEVTGIPWETIHRWSYVAAVLSACWSGQGAGIGWQHAMKVATTLQRLAPLS